MQYWLVKTEPEEFSWDDLVKKGDALWDGIRNYAARKNLRAMKKGDQVFVYHSRQGLEIVGIAEVTKEAFQDPTTEDERWDAIHLKAVKKLKNPVPLSQIKDTPELENMDLVRISRLSVGKVSQEEWDLIIKMSNN